jgi:hypothetical protein
MRVELKEMAEVVVEMMEEVVVIVEKLLKVMVTEPWPVLYPFTVIVDMAYEPPPPPVVVPPPPPPPE